MKNDPTTTTRPADELRILIGGCLDQIFSQLMAEVVKKELGYARVRVEIIETVAEFFETASQSRPDLFMVHLYFGNPAWETIADPITSRAEITARIADATASNPVLMSVFGLEIVTYLRAEFGKPVIVLTGCGDAPGRATRVEQAGASAFLILPFTVEDFVAAVGTCMQGPI